MIVEKERDVLVAIFFGACSSWAPLSVRAVRRSSALERNNSIPWKLSSVAEHALSPACALFFNSMNSGRLRRTLFFFAFYSESIIFWANFLCSMLSVLFTFTYLFFFLSVLLLLFFSHPLDFKSMSLVSIKLSFSHILTIIKKKGPEKGRRKAKIGLCFAARLCFDVTNLTARACLSR